MTPTKSQVGDTFYRYVDRVYAPMLDEFDNPSGPGRVAVEVQKYKVTKVTACGVWIEDERFVNQQRIKQYAHATLEQALAAFLARKERQASILRRQLANVNQAVALAKKDHPETPTLSI
jgi:hypothetical protein